jgi:hypothetical protein
LLTLLLDTGRQRYASTPERGTTASPTPPESLKNTAFGRKLLKYSFIGSSMPAAGSWLHGLQSNIDGATDTCSENEVGSVGNSLNLAANFSAWARSCILCCKTVCICVLLQPTDLCSTLSNFLLHDFSTTYESMSRCFKIRFVRCFRAGIAHIRREQRYRGRNGIAHHPKCFKPNC